MRFVHSLSYAAFWVLIIIIISKFLSLTLFHDRRSGRSSRGKKTKGDDFQKAYWEMGYMVEICWVYDVETTDSMDILVKEE